MNTGDTVNCSRNTATLRVLSSPFTWEGSELRTVDAGGTLDELFSSLSSAYCSCEDYPHAFVALNGEAVPAADWRSKSIPEGASIVVAPAPQGLDPVTWLYILYAVFVVAAIYYASTIQPPDVSQQTTPDASPSYSLNAQGNAARIGSPIPARYGRFRIYPDFAAIPFREYINGDQYLYQLFSIGQGSYAYTNLKIGDTPIGNFQDVEYEFYEPGQDVTLFPADVYSAPEVSGNGITLYAPNDSHYTGISGPYAANAAGTLTQKLAVDFIFPRGLSYANDSGGLDAATISILFEYRKIDDSGNPVGSWVGFPDPSQRDYTLATVDTQRFTVSTAVAAGRYEVRARRTNTSSDDYRLNDEVAWTGLRAYLNGTQVFNHSTLAVKMRATNQLSAQAERKFNVVATRKLPIWSGSAWSAPTATRNPAWAYCDVIKANYGGRYSDAHLDLATIKAIADIWDSRGDSFDGQFDTATTIWPALQQICAVGRAVPYQYGEIFSIIRDGGSPAATYMFNGRNIERDSMVVTYQTMDVWADDSVEIEYIDPSTWKPQTINCAIPGVTPVNPRKVKLFGCTDKLQANREGMFLAAKMAFRSIVAEWSTELDGRVPQYLDRLIVASEIYEWGQGGEVIAVAGSTLTLSEPVTFGSGTHYVWLRDDRGAAAGPYTVTPGAQPNQVVSSSALPGWIYTGHDKERTYFAFARGAVTPRQMLLDQVQPGDGLKVKVRATLDDPRAHQYDAMVNAGTIVTPDPAPPANPDDLTISQLRVVRGGTVTNPALKLSWIRVPAASQYFVEVSYDAGASWARVYDGAEPGAEFNVHTGTVVLRVAAFSDVRGPWYQTTITAGAGFDTPATPSGLALVGGAFNGRSLKLQWSTDVTAQKWRVDYSDLSSVVRFSQTVETNSTSLDVATARLNGLGREFDVHLYALNANDEASSPLVMRVKNNQAATVVGLTATGLLDRVLLEWTSNTDADIAGYRVYASTTNAFTPGSTNFVDASALSYFVFGITPGATWYFRVAAYDVWGESDELNFAAQVSAVGEYITTTSIADDSISTPKLKANSVVASKISVSYLSAISANMGDLTAGTITLDSAGYIKGGTSAYKTGNGFWMGYNAGQYMFSLGHSSSPGVHWDGSNFYIRGAGGATVFSSGTGLDYSSITGTKPPANATNGATFGVNINGTFNPSTWIAAASITRAMIGALNVGTADIVDLNVTTSKMADANVTMLKLGLNSVTVPVAVFSASSSSITSSNRVIQSLSFTNPDNVNAIKVIVAASAQLISASALGQTFTEVYGANGLSVRKGGVAQFSFSENHIGNNGNELAQISFVGVITLNAGETATIDLYAGYASTGTFYSASNRALAVVGAAR